VALLSCAVAATGRRQPPGTAPRESSLVAEADLVCRGSGRPGRDARCDLRRRVRVSTTLLVIGLLAAGCSGAASPPDRLTDVRAARQFESFALYWLGERFEKWELTEIVGLDERTEFVTLVYGDCEPSGGLQPSCTPPLEVQVFPLCPHLDVVARDPIWRHRRIRGAPVGTIDRAPVLFTAGAQVKVYEGEDADRGAALRALRALRSLNDVPPVIGPAARIPAPPAGILSQERRCTVGG
jgi:hypothetical protein